MSGNEPNEFEKELCGRIVDICKVPEQPKREANIQLALCFSCVDSIKKAFKQNLDKKDKKTSKELTIEAYKNMELPHLCDANIEEKTNPCHYKNTNIFKSEINSEDKFRNLSLSAKRLNHKTFNLSIDIAYKFDDVNYNLLEVKYPYRWDYSQGGSPEFKSAIPFNTPFFEIDKNKYIMGMKQEGQMFVDIMRLLNAKNSGLKEKNKYIKDLYFTAFFRNNELPEKFDLDVLQKRLGELFRYYFNNKFKYIMTFSDKNGEGPIDLWDTKPYSMEYFYYKEKELLIEKFDPRKDDEVKLLSRKDDEVKLTAFLLKLTPEEKIWIKGKVKEWNAKDDNNDDYHVMKYIKTEGYTHHSHDTLISKEITIDKLKANQEIWFKQPTRYVLLPNGMKRFVTDEISRPLLKLIVS